MPRRRRDAGELEATVEELAKLLFEDLREARESMSEEEQTAYRDSQQSVVDAVRSAEAHEGLLRIN